MFSFLTIGGIGALHAAPMLRLVSATVGPIAIVPGSNGINQMVEAYNAGDGTLSLSASSSVAWLTPNVSAAAPCMTTAASRSCIPLYIGLNTASLAASTTPYTGVVTVTSPNAVDAPQTITVTVDIGSAVPSSVNIYVPPYVAPPAAATDASSVPFVTTSSLTGKATTQDGAKWLYLSLSGAGSVQSAYSYSILTVPQPTNTAGNSYTGSIVTSGSTFAADNKTIAVTMNVTALPIAQASAAQVTEQLAVGAPVGYAAVTLSNAGLGTLTFGAPSATTADNGPWLTPSLSGNTLLLAFDPTGLAAGTYTASVSVASNAANSPTVIPVTFDVVTAGPPTAFYQGVVDDAVFGAKGAIVSPGDIVALFGQELTFAAPVVGPLPPLATTLGGASVTVNGEPAPLYYSSYGQINFQIPVDTAVGTATVQVFYAPNPMTPLIIAGNSVSVKVVARAPRLLLLTGEYGSIEDASQGYSLPLPPTITFPGFVSQPALPGDVLTIYAIGLGPTSPSVATGQPAPATAPYAPLMSTPTVLFTGERVGSISEPIPATPSYAGLSPYFAGLYQINVAIPAKCPAGTIGVSLEFPDNTVSNSVDIQVQ